MVATLEAWLILSWSSILWQKKPTMLTLTSNPDAHLHKKSRLPATSPIRSDPARHPDTQIPWLHIAEILSCSTVFCQRHAVDSPNSAETLPLFYSEPHIQASVHPHRETDRWQLHRHGTREGQRTAWKPIWQQGRAGMSDCEGFGMTRELQSCVGKKAAIKNTRACSRVGVSGVVLSPSVNACLVWMWASVYQVTWCLCVPAPHLAAQFNGLIWK